MPVCRHSIVHLHPPLPRTSCGAISVDSDPQPLSVRLHGCRLVCNDRQPLPDNPFDRFRPSFVVYDADLPELQSTPIYPLYQSVGRLSTIVQTHAYSQFGRSRLPQPQLVAPSQHPVSYVSFRTIMLVLRPLCRLTHVYFKVTEPTLFRIATRACL